ncbi:MAG: glycosyltransferase involved in cell wall biosynthesis/GT2 family glycosyltransferase [Chlamydiales bacterium]|jgi:glycosyltransferase involved in cell wall biosynthesis/GT2 family glycosyltransferase
MKPIRSVSVLMPTCQGLEFLERVFTALACQDLELPWDFRIIDSASDDGTWELCAAWAERLPVPFAMERIERVEFDHGDTRNLLAARSRGDLLVFLTQDAIPSSPDWLSTLVANFEDDGVGAASCRNIPRPDAEALTRLFSSGDPGYSTERREVSLPPADEYAQLGPHERRLLFGFNDVASAIRRELWERHPFPRTSFGEDILMARALLEAGHTVVYDARATVEHSHDHDARATYERAWIDGKFNAEWLARVCVASAADASTLTERLSAEDTPRIEDLPLGYEARQLLLEQGRELRSAAFRGLYEGGRSERRYPPSRMLAGPQLSILYVVHGFPPDTWAGTEIYTQNLATELQRRGHRVTIFARVPADADGPEDFTVEDSEFQGLRVLRMTNRLQYRTMRDSFTDERAEDAFRQVLEREQPDLVHFQHLIHTSVGLVDVARERGLPTVITCHDYWAVCARVQLIRPDGSRCSGNKGSGCYLCVKEKHVGQIDRVAASDSVLADVFANVAQDVADNEDLMGTTRSRAQDYLYTRERHDLVLDAYAACDLRISPSRFLRSKLLESGRFDPHRFLFSDNGMRTDHIEALAKRPDPQGRVRFGFVGSLVWYKGGETLVRAAVQLDESEAVLLVFGDFKPDEDAHHAELAQLAEGRNVEFRGRFDNSRLSEVYAEIDVLVVPSVWFENSPITIHEAFLTGTPVLASDIGGMAEFVRDGVDGLHFAVGDPDDLAAKMRRFVDEPNLLADLSRDWMRVKTLEENAEETEFRYRGLVCASGAAEVEA